MQIATRLQRLIKNGKDNAHNLLIASIGMHLGLALSFAIIESTGWTETERSWAGCGIYEAICQSKKSPQNYLVVIQPTVTINLFDGFYNCKNSDIKVINSDGTKNYLSNSKLSEFRSNSAYCSPVHFYVSFTKSTISSIFVTSRCLEFFKQQGISRLLNFNMLLPISLPKCIINRYIFTIIKSFHWFSTSAKSVFPI
jgi:hypothetical protein